MAVANSANGSATDFAAPGAEMDPAFFAPALAGTHYLRFLEIFHGLMLPKSYLEIGVRTGNSFGKVICPSIGIDPGFNNIPNTALENKSAVMLFRMTSDEFFERHCPKSLLGRPIDMCFLDGMHWFEFLLRDFINTERACRRNSVIVLHDCVPTDLGMVRRGERDREVPHTRNRGAWTGDVWKMLLILKRYRPALSILTLDCVPTGLVLITNLDPQNCVLADAYFDIVKEFTAIRMQDIGVAAHVASLDLQSAQEFGTIDGLSRRFWF